MRHGALWAPLVVLCMASPGLAGTPASIGARLYLGGAPLIGRIVGQRTALPAAVLVCANCHAGGANEAAPDLRGGWLRLVLSRRNGPAARYTRDGFCRTLRTGVIRFIFCCRCKCRGFLFRIRIAMRFGYILMRRSKEGLLF